MDELFKPTGAPGMDRQLGIYTAGLTGQIPSLPIACEALEQAAKGVMLPESYDYVAGGGASQDTVRANLAAFRRWRIVPRMFRNVAKRDLSAELLGHKLPAPILLAPIGVQGIVRP